ISTYKEPIPWIGNKNGPVVLTLAGMNGYLHVLYWYEHVTIDMIPVDMTINGLLTAIWDFVVNRKSNEPQVYNYASSDWNPIKTFELCDHGSDIVYKNPSVKAVWYPFLICSNNILVFLLLHTLWHVLPSLFIDLFRLLRGKKPVLTRILVNVTKNYRLLSYFASSKWVIKTDKLKEIQNRMNKDDLEEFPCDLGSVDWYK
ncbi:PREDICTED: fatty acyl-CoA reductase 1-like, partial [Eufriesea mexicana]|uniref:fatty acyl-CoA reductase 1-like n=1 Tax=Eufriesea mexicana TaxID=516756 RepID=UPI00083BAC9B